MLKIVAADNGWLIVTRHGVVVKECRTLRDVQNFLNLIGFKLPLLKKAV